MAAHKKIFVSIKCKYLSNYCGGAIVDQISRHQLLIECMDVVLVVFSGASKEHKNDDDNFCDICQL